MTQPHIFISVQKTPIAIADECVKIHSNDNIGAIAMFVGVARKDDGVRSIFIEHYPGMTQKSITNIVEQAASRWQLIAARVIHRYGTLSVGDPIVFVSTMSTHRSHAFAACEYIMDYLKNYAPFWKKEIKDNEEDCWVNAKDSDNHALKRWIES